MFCVSTGVVYVAEVAPVIFVQTELSKRCHCIVPTLPESVNVVVAPLQIEVDPVIVPDTEAGAIVIAPETALAIGDEHVLLTTQ